LGCWNENEIPRVDHPLLFFYDPDSTAKQLLKKCYLLSKSIGHHVFALRNGTECLSSANAEYIYRQNGISSDCQSDGKGGSTAMQVYKIGD
jgi:WSC domain.